MPIAVIRLASLFLHKYRHTEPLSLPKRRGQAIFIRVVDGGSAGDCELEIAGLFNPIYDAARFGIELVMSPRHANVLLITTPIVESMLPLLQTTFQSMPEPRRVITVGSGMHLPVWAASYASGLLPDDISAVWVAHIFGDPPSPSDILSVLQHISVLR